MMKRLYVFAISLVLLATSVVSSTHAQTAPLELNLNPPVAYLHLKPGQTQTHTLTLEHRGTVPVTATVTIVDFKPDGDTGQPVLTDGLTFPHITLVNPQEKIGQPFPLVPGKGKKLQFSLAAPVDAVEREYPLSIMITATPDPQYSVVQTGSQVSGVIVSNLIVLISDSTRLPRQLSIDSIQVPKLVDSFRPLEFTVKLKNNGLFTAAASGSARLKNWQGTVIREWQIYPDMILGQSTRQARVLTGVVSPTPPPQDTPDEAETLAEVDSFQHRSFLLGPYTIETELTNNAESGEIKTVGFIAAPFSFVFLITLGSILLWLGKHFARKKPLAIPKESV